MKHLSKVSQVVRCYEQIISNEKFRERGKGVGQILFFLHNETMKLKKTFWENILEFFFVNAHHCMIFH